jgi:hypothetical protein
MAGFPCEINKNDLKTGAEHGFRRAMGRNNGMDGAAVPGKMHIRQKKLKSVVDRGSGFPLYNGHRDGNAAGAAALSLLKFSGFNARRKSGKKRAF